MTTERDERLAAWLDSALPPDEAEAFAAEVASNPELAAQAEAWRTHDHHITAAFGGAERLIDDALLAPEAPEIFPGWSSSSSTSISPSAFRRFIVFGKRSIAATLS
jgi:anti-sigma factor RsiW